MKQIRYIILLIGVVWGVLSVKAQTEDSLITRDVVVEKEFRPIIQNVGKLNIQPKQVETKVESAKVEYSEYSTTLQSINDFNPLGASSIRFNQPSTPDGYLEVGLGHPLTHLDFGYCITQKRDIRMDLFAKHDAQWGMKAWSESKIGMSFLKRYSTMEVYFDVDGNHWYYTRYGRYFDKDKHLAGNMRDLHGDDFQHVWTVNTAVGVRSRKSETIQYRVQIGYTAFILPDLAVEHQIRSHADVAWQSEEHKAGANIYVQNAFYTVEERMHIPDSAYNARHALRIEPYYEYASGSWRVHAGVNLDMNIGKGRLLSDNENLSFAPSPNIQAEYRIIPTWLAVYAKAEGRFSTGKFQDALIGNPYDQLEPGITSHHVSPYMPIEASLGIKLKPINTLFIDVYARYAYMKNNIIFRSPTIDSLANNRNAFMDHVYADYQRWTVGAELTYHYQDIVNIRLGGHYYAWKQAMENAEQAIDAKKVYERPSWDLHLRIDAKINSKWSLYSDNLFGGSRQALLMDGSSAKMKELIDVRLGAQYNIHRWLSCYLQINNYIHRKNDIFYGYQSLGINGQIGVRWQF